MAPVAVTGRSLDHRDRLARRSGHLGDQARQERRRVMNARKRQLWMVAGIILVLILSACGSCGSGGSGSSSGSGKTSLKIMVGGLSKQIYLPNELTQRLGYFAAQGLDVTLIDEASG